MRLYGSMFSPIGLIGAYHVLVGLTVLLSPEATYVAGLASLRALPHEVSGGLLIAAGGAASYARFRNISSKTRIILVLPQEALLLIQLGGIVGSIAGGVYPDGYVPGHTWLASALFIAGDQAALILLCLTHTAELLLLRALRFPTELDWLRMQQELADARVRAESAQRSLMLSESTNFWISINQGGPDGQKMERQKNVPRL
jgi:hypothetical protein